MHNNKEFNQEQTDLDVYDLLYKNNNDMPNSKIVEYTYTRKNI